MCAGLLADREHCSAVGLTQWPHRKKEGEGPCGLEHNHQDDFSWYTSGYEIFSERMVNFRGQPWALTEWNIAPCHPLSVSLRMILSYALEGNTILNFSQFFHFSNHMYMYSTLVRKNNNNQKALFKGKMRALISLCPPVTQFWIKWVSCQSGSRKSVPRALIHAAGSAGWASAMWHRGETVLSAPLVTRRTCARSRGNMGPAQVAYEW